MRWMNQTFETNVQKLKYEVLKSAARLGFNHLKRYDKESIAKKIIPGPKPTFRCCIHKERQIIKDRLSYALNEIKSDHLIRVIETACDQCPIHRYTVTNSCRGCIARSCENTCPTGAIMMISGRAYINQEKCIECGRCKTVCQFNAISDVERPCRRSCPVNAIEMDENSIAKINYDKCISCGHCVLSCPFGAITDRSFIYNVAEILSQPNNECYALIAPSISSQFDNTTIGQITTGLKQIGFKDVVEVALGADMVIKAETEEYQQRIQHHDFLTTSCCPAFVNIIEKEFPELKEKMSSTVSPMIALARLVKTISPKAKTVFIGPCIAKKDEANRPALKGDIDYVLTFEELRSLFGAKDISLDSLKTTPLDNASRQARLFAIQGGVSSAIKQYIDDQNIDTIYDPIVGNGALECIKLLKLGKFNKLTNSFIEGMACEGGCISGPGSITHRKKDMSQVKKYAYQAKEKTTQDALSVLNVDTIEMHR